MENKENKSELIIYQTEDGQTRLQVKMENETVWLTQDQMAELFAKGRSTITEHIQNVFKEGELDEKSVCREFRRTGSDGKGYVVRYYNLDFAELQATNGRLMKMADWADKLDQFIHLSERGILTHAGTVSADDAAKKAEQEFDKYRKEQDKNYISDFDKAVKMIEAKGKKLPEKKGRENG